MSKIRMGVIGLGAISGLHIDGILVSPDAELFALCDIDYGSVLEKAQKYNIPKTHCFTNYIDLLNCADVDAVSICTPNNSHYTIATDAIRHKKPFALEKPVALSSEEAKQLNEMAKQFKIPNMICFSYRFKSAARYARELIRQGALGKIYHVYAQYLQSWAARDNMPFVWRFNKEITGSGVHGDLGSHMLDLIRFLIGDYVKVCAQAGTFINRRKDMESDEYHLVDVDDYCNYLAELKGGIPASFNITRFAYGRGNYQRVEVYGSKGGLVYTLDEKGDGEDTIHICSGDLYAEAKQYNKLPIPYGYHSEQMQSFFDIINCKSDGLAATIEDGYINQCLLDSIIESFKYEKWVSLSY